ncbi:hypothetical protein L6R53_17000 [Myxococcota bacterium]|nr:hypothetical protein [Myxococcota bacterium]
MPALLLLLALACGPTEAPVVEPAPPLAQELARTLATDLMAARTRYSEGDAEAASHAIRAAYDGPFAALEPILRAHDPQATLELEYAFGRAATHAARKGSDAVPVELDALIADLRQAVAALPVAEGQPAPADGAAGAGGAGNPEITTVPAN